MEAFTKDLRIFFVVLLSAFVFIFAECPPGWKLYNNSCYHFSDQFRPQYDLAIAFCKSKNSSMLVWHSEAELQWVMQQIVHLMRMNWWVGLRLKNHHWTWEDGTQYDRNLVHWERHQEGNTAAADGCGNMYGYPPNLGNLTFQSCNYGMGIICKRPVDLLDFCDQINDWHYLSGSCWKYYNQQMNWYDARATCQRNGGDLLVLPDYQTEQNMWELIPCHTEKNRAWIGVSDTAKPGQWMSIDNSSLRFTHWNTYPIQILQAGQTCAVTDPVNNLGWDTELCTSSFTFVCNRTLGSCPNGWLSHGDRCYQVIDVPASRKSYFNALQYCSQRGTSLLVINSADEQKFILQTLADLHITRAWLAFSDVNQSEVLQWIDGRAVVGGGYENWDTNYPQTDDKRFDCGLITTGVHDAKWSNAYCFNANSFICEMQVTDQPYNPTPAPVNFHCDPNWLLFRDHCYYFGPTQNQSLKDWPDSNDYCVATGGNMVIITDPYEMAFVTVTQSQTITSWIGLRYNPSKQQLLWVDGTQPGTQWTNNTNFYPGEPDDLDDGQWCIQIVGGRQDFVGAWDDGNCSLQQGFICKKNAYSGAAAQTTTPAVGTWSSLCGSDWIYSSVSNFCYQVVLNQPRTWSASQSDCQQRGGNLLSISGTTEQNFVQAVLSTGIYASIQMNLWIGSTDQSREGGWKWIDSTPFRYLNWYPGEPNNRILSNQPEDCGEMVPTWNFQWNDKKCNKEQQYICKKPAAQVTSSNTVAPTLKPDKGSCVAEAMISGNYSLADPQAFGATSSRDTSHVPSNSRYPGIPGGGWSAQFNNSSDFITVTFYNTVIVKGIITAGRSDVDEWVKSYKLQYQDNYYSEFLTYQDPPGTDKIFTANTDGTSPVTNMINFPFEAQTVKLIPVTWQQGISLKWEILGCFEVVNCQYVQFNTVDNAITASYNVPYTLSSANLKFYNWHHLASRGLNVNLIPNGNVLEDCVADYAVSGPLIVLDSGLMASSIADPRHSATAARLHPIVSSAALSCWQPQQNDVNQWIQVDIGSVMIIRGVTTMGNPDAFEYVMSYKVQYNVYGPSQPFLYYNEPYGVVRVLPGNSDNTSPVTNYFKSHFQARFIRILPISWKSNIALRLDILVCPNGCKGIPLLNGDHKVTDDKLNASSSMDNEHGPFRSRLNQPSEGIYSGAWVPMYNDHFQYIQVDLGYMIQVTAVATQGAFDSESWVRSYQLSYSNDGKTWYPYLELDRSPRMFLANWDRNTVRKNFLLIPFIARYVRLWPQGYQTKIALRWELYGCPGADSGTRIDCFADDPHDPDLPYEPFTDPSVGMWPPMCVHHCFNKGYYYAGVQAQYKCFCGNSYGRYGPATDCNQLCFPNNRFICGGPSSSVIYTTGLTPESKICPPRWKGYGDQCYILLLDKRAWFDARADCQMLGGDLSSPNNQQQQDFVYSLLQYGDGHDAWIGFNDLKDETLFEWSSGKQVMYTNWDVFQPQHISSSSDCVLISSQTGGWKDDVCDRQRQYVCQMGQTSSDQPTRQPAIMGCEQGWDGYRWSCYLFLDAVRTWNDAGLVCKTFGSYLVRIDDRFEQAYLSSTLGSKKGQYWTDVTDQFVPGLYQYADGNTYIPYTNWAQNKPDMTAQCVILGTGTAAGLWYNVNCTSRFGAICEKLRMGFTTPTPPPTTAAILPCPSGWVDYNGLCYQINSQPVGHQLNWIDAQTDCNMQGARLASFHSVSDMDYIWRNALVGFSFNFWIGLNDRAVENGYVWSDGSPVQFTNWNVGEPNNFQGTEDCVEIWSSNGKMNDQNCYSARNWICMIKKGQAYQPRATIMAPTAGDPNQCAPYYEYSYYNGFCYNALDGAGDNGKTWREARQVCQIAGGELASIHGIQEQWFIFYRLLANASSYAVWIGLSEIDWDRGYRWSDGSQVSFMNWATGEPNDYGGAEDCVSINIRDGSWNDAICSSKAGYVCKRRVGAAPTPVAPTQPWTGFCPVGFNLHVNKCFRIFTDAVNFTTALSMCQAFGKGYTLASVQNQGENAFLVTLLANMNVNPWLGLEKDDSGHFYWISNEDLYYTNWAFGEPNGQQREKCVHMYGSLRDTGMWNDIGCWDARGYVCQTSKKASIPTPEPTPNICNLKQGFKQFQMGCYLYVGIPMTWEQANQNCNQKGAYLISVNSVYEESFIFLMVDDANVPAIWIGLNDRQKTGSYVWIDNWPVMYTKWDVNEPTKGPNEGCVLFNRTGLWSDVSCNITLPFICKITSDSPPYTPPAPNGRCNGVGWYFIGQNCYMFFQYKLYTFLDASFDCNRRGGNLVSIHNETVNMYLVQMMTNLSSPYASFWTSLHKSVDAGFLWIDNTPLQYINWRPGEPSVRGWGGNEENCVEVFLSDGKWNDEDCNSKKPYICEKPEDVDPQQLTSTSQSSALVPTQVTQQVPTIISLPAQKIPTLRSITTISQPPIITAGVPTSLTPGITRPAITLRQYTGTQPPSPLSQHQKDEEYVKSMSPGSIAAIILATVVFLIIVMGGLLYWRKKTASGQAQFSRESIGIENTLYHYDPTSESLQSHDISQHDESDT